MEIFIALVVALALLAPPFILRATFFYMPSEWAIPLVWVVEMIVMVVLLVGWGWARKKRIDGALIDETNHIKLSRLQAFLWIIIAASALWVLVVLRLLALRDLTPEELTACTTLQTAGGMQPAAAESFCSQKVPLQITIPQELWWAIGISVTSFVGANLVLSTKQEKTPNDETLARLQRKSLDKAFKEAKVDPRSLEPWMIQRMDLLKETDERSLPRIHKLTAARRTLAVDLNPYEIASLKFADSPVWNTGKVIDLQAKTPLHPQNNLEPTVWELLKHVPLEELDSLTETTLMNIKNVAKFARSNSTISEERVGIAHANQDPKDASWMDLVRGDEIVDYENVNVGKVQMLFFTLIIVAAYGMAVWQLLGGPLEVLRHPLNVALPSFSEQFDIILGVSHAGYLAAKAVDQTPKA